MYSDAQALSERRGYSMHFGFAALLAILFLTFLDNTIISAVLANVQSDLHAGITDLQWIVGAYALTFASLMLICGSLGDNYGRKRIMLIGVGIFCAGSIVCGLATSSTMLISDVRCGMPSIWETRPPAGNCAPGKRFEKAVMSRCCAEAPTVCSIIGNSVKTSLRIKPPRLAFAVSRAGGVSVTVTVTLCAPTFSMGLKAETCSLSMMKFS